MNSKTRQRIQGLINLDHQSMLKYCTKLITEDLVKEEFETQDIKEYISIIVNDTVKTVTIKKMLGNS